MKIRLLSLLLVASLLAGCSRTARLYPVQGPLSRQTPLPVFTAKLSGAFNSGNLTATLSNGEVFKGRWAAIPRPKPGKGQSAATDPSANAMSSEWDAVYGPGYYLAHVLGARLYARGDLKGSAGTTLNVEMYRPTTQSSEALPEIKGVAKDNNSNIYKLAF